MSNQSSKYIDWVKEESLKFDYPAELQFNEYREPARQADVVQVHFRYHPFRDINEKFAFELAFTDKSQMNIDKQHLKQMRRREIRHHLRDLEAAVKDHFNFVFYRGVPYAKEIDGPHFHLKCEICDADIKVTGCEMQLKQDLYLIYCLKNIDCNCGDGWNVPEVKEDLVVEEGEHLPRFSVLA